VLQIVTALFVATAAATAPTAASAQAPGSATISGTVRDATGKPLASVDVLLRSSDTTRQALRTNANGEFAAAKVPPGAYPVWVRPGSAETVAYDLGRRTGHRAAGPARLGGAVPGPPQVAAGLQVSKVQLNVHVIYHQPCVQV